MTGATTEPISKRRYMLRIALRSLGIGIVLALIGWWVWRPLFYLGCLMGIFGVGWLVGLPMHSNDDPITPAYRRYLRTVLSAMMGYVLAIFVLDAVKSSSLPLRARIPLVLLPVVPIGWTVFAMWRYARDVDELEQRVQREAVYLTCGVVGLLAFAVGMLELADIVTLQAGLFFVLPGMFVVYGIVNRFCRRRYGLRGCN